MSLLTSSAASIHQLGAAAAVAGAMKDVTSNRNTAGRWWSRHQAIANAIMTGGWIIEQHTIRRHADLDARTNAAVRTKDVCVAGAMITNIANIIAGYLAKRSGKRTARKYERYFKVMRLEARK